MNLNDTKNILTFFGTRPEAIKMIPVIRSLRKKGFKVTVGLSGQHTDMVDQLLELFGETADFTLNIQGSVKNVEDPIVLIIPGLCAKLREIKPDLILVHGDTSSTLAGALAGYYERIPVGHVEAGLRSSNIFHPWPEEINRKLTADLTLLHFAPTTLAMGNLLRENVPGDEIFVTGNTVVDALYMMNDEIEKNDTLRIGFEEKYNFLNKDKKWILMTGHRRENLGEGLNNVMQAILELSKRSDVEIIFPVHPNPKVRSSFAELITIDCPVHIVDPLPYSEMVWLLSRSSLVITDSGGIQEEAPSFKVPAVVTRETTERKEAVLKGWAKLVGTDKQKIIDASNEFLDSTSLKQYLDLEENPYGDGTAADQISSIIESLTCNEGYFFAVNKKKEEQIALSTFIAEAVGPSGVTHKKTDLVSVSM